MRGYKTPKNRIEACCFANGCLVYLPFFYVHPYNLAHLFHGMYLINFLGLINLFLVYVMFVILDTSDVDFPFSV